MPAKTYGQFCGLARALDHVGDRWTLLIIRELLLGPRTFAALQVNLDGISPNLLVDRLRSLATDRLVERNEAPARSKAVEYRLTDEGAALEPAVLALIRWGARWMTSGPGGDHVEPAWSTLALRALLNDTPTERSVRGYIHLDVDGQALTIAISRGRRTVLAGHHRQADATVTVSMPAVLAAASGLATLPNAAITGDRKLALAALQTTP